MYVIEEEEFGMEDLHYPKAMHYPMYRGGEMPLRSLPISSTEEVIEIYDIPPRTLCPYQSATSRTSTTSLPI